MRKILAITLALSLAMSGTAFAAADKFLATGSISDWQSAEGKTSPSTGEWDTSGASTSRQILPSDTTDYPGKTKTDEVTLDASAANVTAGIKNALTKGEVNLGALKTIGSSSGAVKIEVYDKGVLNVNGKWSDDSSTGTATEIKLKGADSSVFIQNLQAGSASPTFTFSATPPAGTFAIGSISDAYDNAILKAGDDTQIALDPSATNGITSTAKNELTLANGTKFVVSGGTGRNVAINKKIWTGAGATAANFIISGKPDTDGIAFAIASLEHAYSSLTFKGTPGSEVALNVVNDATRRGYITADSNGIAIFNAYLPTEVVVKGTLILDGIYSNTGSTKTTVDMSATSTVLKLKDLQNAGTSKAAADVELGLNGAKNFKLNAGGSGQIWQSIFDNTDTKYRRFITKDDFSDVGYEPNPRFMAAVATEFNNLENVKTGYFVLASNGTSGSTANGVATIDGHLALYDSYNTVNVAAGGLKINGTFAPYTGVVAAAATDNPTITIEDKGVMGLYQTLGLKAQNGKVGELIVAKGGTLVYETKTPATKEELALTTFKSGATLRTDETVTLPETFKVDGDFTLNIKNDTNTTKLETKAFSVPANSIFKVTGEGTFSGSKIDGKYTELYIPKTSTFNTTALSIIFDVALDGTLQPTSLPLKFTNMDLDGKLIIGDEAKLDLIQYGIQAIKAKKQERVLTTADFAKVIATMGNSGQIIFGKSSQAKAKVLTDNGIRVLFKAAPGNDLTCNGAKLDASDSKYYSFPAILNYDDVDAGVFTLSVDIEVAAAEIQEEDINPATPGNEYDGSEGKDLTTAGTPAGTYTLEDDVYNFATADAALTWTFAQKQTIGTKTVTIGAGNVTANLDGETVDCTKTVSGNDVTVKIPADAVYDDDEFTLSFSFADTKLAAAEGVAVTSKSVKVVIGDGLLTPSIIGTTSYDLSTASKAEFTIEFENKFKTVEATNITWAVADKTGEGKDVTFDLAGLDAGTYPVTVTATYGDLTITEPVSAGTLTLTKSDTPKGGSSGGGCSAGVASLALLLAIPMLLKKR